MNDQTSRLDPQLQQADEKALRELDTPWPKTEEEMLRVVRSLIDRQHDYGTCVYAMSLSALAAFRYVASKLGVTGFQASCADMDFLGRSRGMKHGFQILNYENLLYPQYLDKFEINWRKLVADNAKDIGKLARAKLLETNAHTHPDVRAHWQMLVAITPEADEPEAEAA